MNTRRNKNLQKIINNFNNFEFYNWTIQRLQDMSTQNRKHAGKKSLQSTCIRIFGKTHLLFPYT